MADALPEARCSRGLCQARSTTATIDQLNKYFALCQMPIISARYWNGVHG